MKHTNQKVPDRQNRPIINFLEQDAQAVGVEIREGRFQRKLALITALSSVLGGAEVAYMHYRGSFSRRIMYTPLACAAALFTAGLWAIASRKAARTALRAVCVVTLADSVTGFYFHIRGIQRKPGGWRLPVLNIVMGPPLMAPLLFGVSAYLGLIASYLRRSGHEQEAHFPRPAEARHIGRLLTAGKHDSIDWEQDIREGRFQKHMSIATMVAAFLSGFEALYSHYKNGFQYKWAQSSPLVIAPALMAGAGAAIKSRRAAHTVLPVLSLAAMVDGAIGSFYHVRGVARRPAGFRKPLYNIVWGPPVFAPLLFAAAGFLGLLASLFRREK